MAFNKMSIQGELGMPGPRHSHLSTGSIYKILGFGKQQISALLRF